MSLSAYLLFFRHKHFLGLFDHRLRLEFIVCELVFAGVKQLASRYTGQDQVGGVRLVVDLDLDLVRADGLGCHSVVLCGHLWAAEEEQEMCRLSLKQYRFKLYLKVMKKKS